MKSTKSSITAIIAFVLSAAIIVLGIGIGSVFVSPSEIVTILAYKIFSVPLPIDTNESLVSIMWNIRIPRVILAFLVGASVSASGAVVQSVLKNALASPFTLGVSSGASLGAAIVLASGISLFGGFSLAFSGLIFAVITVFLAVRLASKLDSNLESTTIVLTGMVISLFINAIVTLIANMSHERYQQIMKWQTGSFSGRGWEYVKILIVVLAVCLAVFLHYSRELDILTFGDEQSRSIGVNTKSVKRILLAVTAVLTGTAVAFAGVIGFIDLVAPHVVRKIFGSNHKVVVPLSAALGGMFMVIADLIARTVISPDELPVGVVTAIIGSPFFAYVFFCRRKKRG